MTSVKYFKVKIAKLAEKYGLQTFIFPENHWHLPTTGVKDILFLVEMHCESHRMYEGGSKCNENPFITPSSNALGFYAICQTNDQSIAFIIVQETLFYLSKFNKLQTF